MKTLSPLLAAADLPLRSPEDHAIEAPSCPHPVSSENAAASPCANSPSPQSSLPSVRPFASLKMSTFPSHHDSRRERLLWGNQLVAGLGSPLPAKANSDRLRQIPSPRPKFPRFPATAHVYSCRFVVSSSVLATLPDPSPPKVDFSVAYPTI